MHAHKSLGDKNRPRKDGFLIEPIQITTLLIFTSGNPAYEKSLPFRGGS